MARRGMPVTTKMLPPSKVLEEKHWQERKTFQEIDAANFGMVTLPVAGKMSETPLRVKWVKTDLELTTTMCSKSI